MTDKAKSAHERHHGSITEVSGCEYLKLADLPMYVKGGE